MEDEDACLEKDLFAEDIVNYFMYGKMAEKDEARMMQKVFENLDDPRDAVISEDFQQLKSKNKVDLKSLEEYALSYRQALLKTDFETMCFMRYCLYVCGMAVMFHNNGVEDVPAATIELIKKGTPEGCLPEEFWEIFYKAIKKYIAQEFPELVEPEPETTPEDSPPSWPSCGHGRSGDDRSGDDRSGDDRSGDDRSDRADDRSDRADDRSSDDRSDRGGDRADDRADDDLVDDDT